MEIPLLITPTNPRNPRKHPKTRTLSGAEATSKKNLISKEIQKKFRSIFGFFSDFLKHSLLPAIYSIYSVF